MVAGTKMQLGKGKPFPYGCSEGANGAINFSLLSPQSEGASLVIAGCGQLRLSPDKHRTGSVWHCEVKLPVAATGLRYHWLLDLPAGPDSDPLAAPKAAEQPKRILDPCARTLDSVGAQGWNVRGGPKYAPSAVVPDFEALRAFNWEGVRSPGLALKDLVIYEAHVRSFTRHPDSGIEKWALQAGTFLGFIQKIPHLLRLGINCVELLPIFEFDETACPRVHPETEEPLCNYWGYSTVSYYTPMQRFAARIGIKDRRAACAAAAILEFRTLVRELHRHGIEVILDVVFNHTGEGSWGESNWHSLSAVAESHYYLMSKGYHTNYTGCGNTVNANNPVCADWICDCLRFWAMEMHVDGFRFDLAAALTRGEDGKVSPDPLLMRRLANDPMLSHVKFIAEPWDCSWPDGYLVGKFPSGGPSDGKPRFAEWNGKFRDTVRRFIKGDPSMKGDFATRLCGSADLYEAGGRGPCHSVNFVTAHDGFTLYDLVSYHNKNNSENAEESGEEHNISWNCGVEGPTDDLEVLALRDRQMRNFFAALFLSAGTPMLLSGDEYGRSQNGNNNTWCQDARNWFSWEQCLAQESDLVRFCRLMIAIRRRHSELFAREDFQRDITWNHESWEDSYNFISFILQQSPSKTVNGDALSTTAGSATNGSELGSASCAASDAGYPASEAGSTRYTPTSGSRRQSPAALLVAFNAGHLEHPVKLPEGRQWCRLVDTSLAAPMDVCECDEDAQGITGESYLMTKYSCIVLKSYEDPADAFQYSDLELECGREQQVDEELRRVARRSLAEELEPEPFEQVSCGNPVAW